MMGELRKILIFLLIFGWIFSGPPTLLRAEEATSTLTVISISTSTPELESVATSTIEITTSSTISIPANSPISTAVSSPSLIEELAPPIEILQEEEEFVEEPAPQPELQSQPTSSLPPLKERKLTKEIHIDTGARHSCAAKNFNVNLAGKNQVMVELEFTGMRSDLENLEIGSLPSGIDVAFLNNAAYEYRPQKSDGGAVLQITNQPGSQRGNFSIPIIYTSGNSTTACQINVINF